MQRVKIPLKQMFVVFCFPFWSQNSGFLWGNRSVPFPSLLASLDALESSFGLRSGHMTLTLVSPINTVLPLAARIHWSGDEPQPEPGP